WTSVPGLRPSWAQAPSATNRLCLRGTFPLHTCSSSGPYTADSDIKQAGGLVRVRPLACWHEVGLGQLFLDLVGLLLGLTHSALGLAFNLVSLAFFGHFLVVRALTVFFLGLARGVLCRALGPVHRHI